MKTYRYGIDFFYGIGLGFDKSYIKSKRYKYNMYTITIIFVRLGVCVRDYT